MGGAALAGIGLILTLVALWLRRGATMQEQLRDVEIDRRLRGRSEMEAELRQAEQDTEQQLGSLGLDDLAAAEDLLAREEAHVARIDQLTAQLDGLVGQAPRETLAAQRAAAALEVEQKIERARGSRPDRQGAARPRTARGRGPRPGDGASSGLATTRPTRAPASRTTRSMPSRSPRRASAWPWREQLAALQRRHRVLETTLRAIEAAEVATMKTATRYLEGPHGPDLAAVTGGRYRRVRVDDKTLDIEVHAPERQRLGPRRRPSARARSTSSTWPPGSASSGS